MRIALRRGSLVSPDSAPLRSDLNSIFELETRKLSPLMPAVTRASAAGGVATVGPANVDEPVIDNPTDITDRKSVV